MKDKKNLPYEKARIVKGHKKWYIHYKQTNPKTGLIERKRPTFNINYLTDKKEKLAEAEKWKKFINDRLPYGYPFEQPKSPKEEYDELVDDIQSFLAKVKINEYRNRVGEQLIKEIKNLIPDVYPFGIDEHDPKNTNILGAIDWMERIKYAELASNETIRKKKEFVDSLRGYLEKNKLTHLKISEFSNIHAAETMRYIDNTRNINNNTFNRFLENAIIFFNLLEDNDYIYRHKNPFKKVRKKRKQEKERRNFTPEEQKIVGDYLKQNNYWLYLASLLQYGCYIRPGALNLLKFKHFNFQLGVIRIPGYIVKTDKTKTVTIPKKIVGLFREEKFKNHHSNWFVFGHLCQPGPVAIRPGFMRKKHAQYLNKMKRTGLLEDIIGLQWYSWKDSGITDALKQMHHNFVRIQADHEKMETTLKYDHADLVNEGMLNFDIAFV